MKGWLRIWTHCREGFRLAKAVWNCGCSKGCLHPEDENDGLLWSAAARRRFSKAQRVAPIKAQTRLRNPRI
jgi:hypothetical protein